MIPIRNTLPPASRHARPDVTPILNRVRADGDAALRELNLELDSYDGDLLVSDVDRTTALEALPDAVIDALDDVAAAVRAHHIVLRRETITTNPRPGVTCTVRWNPLARAGVYVPGGHHPYISTVIMTLVPAQVAGVPETVVCTPPGPTSAVVGAAHHLGASHIIRVGGAHAIAAMAYGTASVPACDVVVGPGNTWVDAAKRAIAGDVRIDTPAGPSEVAILAGPTAPVKRIAAELMAQAEHGPSSRVVAFVPTRAIADGLHAELKTVPLACTAALRAGAIIIADPEAARAQIEAMAPEHVVLLDCDMEVTHAGLTVRGAAASVAWTDYVAGPSHVLPTGGAGRSWAGINLDTFQRCGTQVEISNEILSGLGALDALARVEGLDAHRIAAERSLE